MPNRPPRSAPARTPVVADHHAYLTSLAGELLSQTDRVRNLIGARHWLSDGQHKESILLSVLDRHLPSGILARRGFILNPDDPRSISREQDVLVVDTFAEAPVFSRGDFVVALSSSVVAAISVKTTMTSTTTRDTCDVLGSARNVDPIRFADGRMWSGGFFYQASQAIGASPSKARAQIMKACGKPGNGEGKAPTNLSGLPDLLCAAPDLIFRPKDVGTDETSILGFRVERLAVAVFLGALLDHIRALRTNTRSDFTRLLRGIPASTI